MPPHKRRLLPDGLVYKQQPRSKTSPKVKLTASTMRRAADMWLDMEAGKKIFYGSCASSVGDKVRHARGEAPDEWLYPPEPGEKVSKKEIYNRVFKDSSPQGIDILDDPIFHEYIETRRRERETRKLLGKYSALEHVKPLVFDMIADMYERLAAVRLGVSKERVPFGVYMREIPKWVKMVDGLDDDLEKSGVNVNIVQQHFKQIEDPARKVDAMAEFVKALQDKLYSNVIEGHIEETADTATGES